MISRGVLCCASQCVVCARAPARVMVMEAAAAHVSTRLDMARTHVDAWKWREAWQSELELEGKDT